MNLQKYLLVLLVIWIGTHSRVQSQNCDCTLSQGNFSATISPLSSAQTAAQLYQYGNPVGASSNSGLEASNQARLFLHENTNTGEISLVILMDDHRDGSGGQATIDFRCLPFNAYLAVADDAPEFTSLFPSVIANWYWNACCTDGGVIGGLSCNMAFDILPAFNVGLNGIQWLSGNLGNPTVLQFPSMSQTINLNCGGGALDLGPDQIACESYVINPQVLGGSYLWQDSSTAPTFYVDSSGTYFVQIVSDCDTLRDTITITIQEPPSLTLPDDTIFCSPTNYNITASVPGNPPGLNYAWSTGQSGNNITVNQTGTYSVTVSDGVCSAANFIRVEYLSPPDIDLGNDTTVCPNPPYLLDANHLGSFYQWSNGSSSPTLPISESGLYTVLVTNPCGLDSDSVRITVLGEPLVDLGVDVFYCDSGPPVPFDVSDPWAISYLWQDGASQPNYTAEDSGTYSVSLIGICATATDSIKIVYQPLPIPFLGEDTIICTDRSILLNPEGEFISYLWSNGSTSPSIEIKGNQSVEVTVTDLWGCTGEGIIDIQTEECQRTLFIPNAFSPNGDGLNDLFSPVEKNLIIIQIDIRDRWGKIIFKGNSAAQGWNGKFRGKDVPEGVYLWQIQYENDLGEAGLKSGTLTLIR